jgi:hypothetical protein
MRALVTTIEYILPWRPQLLAHTAQHIREQHMHMLCLHDDIRHLRVRVLMDMHSNTRMVIYIHIYIQYIVLQAMALQPHIQHGPCT